jgi:hypothetical protein
MTVLLDGEVIRLDGPSRVEDAETLLAHLRAADSLAVDLGAAERLHTAVVQVLLACRPRLVGASTDPFDAVWLMPMLRDPAAAPNA